MRLQERGAERGKINEPPSDSSVFDDVEDAIFSRVETEKRTVNASYADQVQTYNERLDSLGFEERFADIRQAAPAAISDFKAEAAKGRDELYALRKRIVSTEKDRDRFRDRHRIERTANVSSAQKRTLKVGLLLFIGVIEIVLNGGFLSKGNEQGLLGGAVQAFSFAFLNILGSFMFGLFLIPQANYRFLFRKLIGLVSIAAYLAFAIYLNLMVAHTRELAGTFDVQATIEVMRRMQATPFALQDAMSWVLLAVGFLFSIIAMLDGLYFKDPYPGYESIETAWLSAQTQYSERKAELIDNLADIRNVSADAMNEAARDLSMKRGEFDSILQARARLNTGFADFQSQLETTARSLLTRYREANREARSEPKPKRFDESFTLERSPIIAEAVTETARADLRKSIASSQKLLGVQIDLIAKEFDEAVAGYRQIDDLIPEVADGSQTNA